MNCILVRYGEIGTKSKRTRRWWERIFIKNIQSALEAHGIEFSKISNPRGRIVVSTGDERAMTVLNHVFGVSSLSFAIRTDRTMQSIKEEALALYQRAAQPDHVFRVSTQRLDKGFDLTSQEVNTEVGAYIVEKEHAQVNLSNPDIDIGIEIMYNAAYVFTGRIPAFGGIPVGVQGTVLVNLTDRKSTVAAWMMLKRGCRIAVYGNEALLPYLESFSYGHPVEFFSHPEKAKNYLALVFSDFKLEKREVPSFYPLLGLDEQRIQEIVNVIFEHRNE